MVVASTRKVLVGLQPWPFHRREWFGGAILLGGVARLEMQPVALAVQSSRSLLLREGADHARRRDGLADT
jgi:hypothetical protein